MITVGIKELKANLSSYVAKAKDGEEVVITDHGKKVAMVVPISPERRLVDTLMDSGKATWSGGKPKGKPGVKAKGTPVSDTVLEERR
jgi:prevent-host-death family protein